MQDILNLAYYQASRLYELVTDSGSTDTVGAKHNPTTRTTAHAGPDTRLYAYVKDNGWLHHGTVLVFHGTECSDEFRVEEVLGKWKVSHISVG